MILVCQIQRLPLCIHLHIPQSHTDKYFHEQTGLSVSRHPSLLLLTWLFLSMTSLGLSHRKKAPINVPVGLCSSWWLYAGLSIGLLNLSLKNVLSSSIPQLKNWKPSLLSPSPPQLIISHDRQCCSQMMSPWIPFSYLTNPVHVFS